VHRSPGFRASLAIGLLALLAVMVPSAIASAAKTCAHARTTPGEDARAAYEATLCLLNRERAAHGLRPLRESDPLDRAASGHSKDMVRRRFFDHTAPGNVSFIERIRRARYSPRGSWAVAENIAWGSGQLAQPLHIVQSWMRSPGHRANILDGRFRSIGIGVARGVPVAASSGGATYTTDFGSR
jgi:uncharacterized protein YkwD